MQLADYCSRLFGPDLPVRFEAYDGSSAGPSSAATVVHIKSQDVARRLLGTRGELGLGRAYVAGEIDVSGDIYSALSLRDRLGGFRIRPSMAFDLLRLVGIGGLRPLPHPAEEVHLRGRRHSKGRDALAVSGHYDVGNPFYELVLGPSLTYSCAVFTSPEQSLEEAQQNKHELVSRKLALESGMRLLDVGCGWGSMIIHAAERHGVDAVGVTISSQQVSLATQRLVATGLSSKVEVRLEDYRDVTDGPYDAICSIGMFEHVGEARLGEYFARLFELLAPGGRLLNHGISRPPGKAAGFSRSSFVDRYVFPDGELHEVGKVVSSIQMAGFEVRHLESLREHYARTLRAWVGNLEARWEEALDLVGAARARIWRLYMAAAAMNFEANRTQVHQVLAVKPDAGRSNMGLRPDWELSES